MVNQVKYNSLLNTIVMGLVALSVSLSGCSPETTSNSPQTAAKGGTLAKIKARDQIVVGVKTDYAPFGFIDAKGNHAGLEIDLARQIAEELLGSPDKIKFVPVVAANRIEFLQQGKVDLAIATMTETEERRQVIDFSENYYASGTGLLARKESAIATWDDLKGKKVCGIQGAFYNKELSEMEIEMVNFPGTAEAYKALKEGRCLGFAYDESALVGKVLEPEWANDWHQALPPIFSTPWGMGIRKGDSAFLERINRAILKLEAEGAIVEGEKKWQIPPTAYARKRMERAKAIISP